MIVLWKVLFFVLGAAVGSFLNLVADRIPTGKSIVLPSSHCSSCQRRLISSDLVPIFSYLWIKGRCRYCGAVIPMRLLWMELGTAVLFTFLYWYYGLGWELAMFTFYCCLFIILLVIDLEHGILPNKIVYPGIVVALLIAILGSIFGFEPRNVSGSGFELWIIDAVIGGGIYSGFLFIVALVSLALGREGMGGGDIKLVGFIGLVIGWPLVLVAMFLAIVGGGLVAVILLLLRMRKHKETIPFGPFLSVAAMATLFWGNSLLAWYLGLS